FVRKARSDAGSTSKARARIRSAWKYAGSDRFEAPEGPVPTGGLLPGESDPRDLLQALDDVTAERAAGRIVLGHGDLPRREIEAHVAEGRNHSVARELVAGRRHAGVRQGVDPGGPVVGIRLHEGVEVFSFLRLLEDLGGEHPRLVLRPGDVLARNLARERDQDVLELDVPGGGRGRGGGRGGFGWRRRGFRRRRRGGRRRTRRGLAGERRHEESDGGDPEKGAFREHRHLRANSTCA